MRDLLLIVLLCLSLLSLFAESGTAPSKVSSPRIEPAEPLPAPVPVIIDRNEPKEGIPVVIPEPTIYRPVLIDRNEPKVADTYTAPFTVPPELIPTIKDRNEPKDKIAKSGGQSPLYDPDSYEPDNSSTQYTAINVYSEISTQEHTIHTDSDQDWFRFQGVAGRIYTFMSTGTIDVRIYLYADDGVTLLGEDDDDGEGYNFYLQFAPTTTAYYKLKVDAWYMNQGNYTFHHIFGATPDSYEPDDTAAQTTTIDIYPVQASQNHTLHSNDDQDWFEFFAYTGRIYTFESTGTTDTQIYLYQSDGATQLDYDDDDGGEANFLLQFSPPVSDYYKIKIVPYPGSGGVYIFYYSYGANPDGYEPDDSAADYTDTNVYYYQQTQNHTLHNTTDQDWYRFYAYAGNIYKFSSSGNQDTRAWLYNDSATTILAVDDDGAGYPNFSLSYAITSSGFYKLKVDGYGGTVGAYDLHYWWELPPDAFEPDNNSGDPTGINPAYAFQYQAHTLHNNTDEDWFVFLGIPGSVYTFYSTGSIDNQIYLYAEDGITQLDWDDDDGDGNNFSLQFEPTVFGNYLLRVLGYAGDVAQYYFYFNQSAVPDAYEPDNSSSQYTEIPFSSIAQIRNHTLHTDTDQDWFRFYAVSGAGKYYQISSLGYTNTQVYLYQDNGTTLVDWDEDDGTDSNFYMQFAPVSTGWYKLKITGHTGSVGAYQFRFIMEGLYDDYEPDDSATQPTVLTPTLSGQFQYHAFNSGTDEDWYIFEGKAGKTYTFHSEGVVDTQAWLYHSDGSSFIAYDDDGTGTPNFILAYTPLYTDYYLIQVTAWGGEVGSYQFHYQYSSAADAYEPDESVADPTALTVLADLQTQAHSLHTTTDQDWYRFQGLAGRTYHFYSTSGTDTQIYLYADNGTTQLAWNDDSGTFPNFHLVFAPTATAYYTLKVVGCLGDVGAYGFNYYFGIPLAPPADVTLSVAGSNLTLSWSLVPGAVSYLIESSDNPNSGFAYVGSATGTSWSVPVPAERKFYRIRASDQPMP